jgi:putative methyltransferase
MNKRRFKELNANLKSAGVTCAHTLNGNFLKVTIPFDEIDFILLDPSCSGSGIRNRNDDTEIIDEERLKRLSSLQISMVTYALTNFPKVKRVTYSTCSIHSQENEQVVETILDQFKDNFQV